MQKTIIKFLGFSIIGLFIGLLIGRTNIFSIFYFTAGTVLVFLIFVIGKIVVYFTKSKSSIVIDHIGFIALSFIVALVTSFVTMANIIDRKQKFAEALIPKIEQYRQQNSRYPQNLDNLAIDNKQMFYYWTDSTRQTYTIRFMRDGWHFSKYDSKNKEWITGD